MTRQLLLGLVVATLTHAAVIPLTLIAVDDGPAVPTEVFLRPRNNRTVYQYQVPEGITAVNSLTAMVYVRDDGDPTEEESFAVEMASNLGYIIMREYCCFLSDTSTPAAASVTEPDKPRALAEILDNNRFKIRVIRGWGDLYVERLEVTLDAETTAAAVPEPTTVWLAAGGLAVLGARRRFARKRS